MRWRRRSVLGMPLGLACGLMGLQAPQKAAAQVSAERTITLVVPAAAGSGPDLLNRVLARSLERLLGQGVAVSNRPGAGGLIGSESVARAAPDGQTLLASSVVLVIHQALQGSSRLDAVNDFEHISVTGTGYSILVVPNSSPYNTLEALIEALRRRPGALAYGSGGIGSLAHLSAEALLAASGTRALHVPYRSSVDLQQALDSGDVAFAAPIQSTALPLVRRGQLRALAITGGMPSPLLPGVPTLRQKLATADAVIEGWGGLSAPRGTPRPIINRIHAAVLKAVADSAVQAAARELDVGVVTSETPDACAAFVAEEAAKFARLARVIPREG